MGTSAITAPRVRQTRIYVQICLPPNRVVSPSVCGQNGYIYIWSWKSLRHSGRDETHVSVSKTLGKSEGKSLKSHLCILGSFPGGSVRKYPLANAKGTGDAGSIPGLGRPPGEGNGNPCQYSCQQTFMGRAAWWATVHGLAKSQTRAGTNSCMPCIRDWGGWCMDPPKLQNCSGMGSFSRWQWCYLLWEPQSTLVLLL